MRTDLRVQKTRQAVQSKFFDLLETHEFQDITIKMLILECKINRSSFYRNYEDKYDLVDKIVEELMGQFEKVINPHFVSCDTKEESAFTQYFLPMLNYFECHKRALLSMHKRTLPVNIFDQMQAMYRKYIFKELVDTYHIQESQLENAAFFSQIIASNILTSMKWWHLENPRMSKEAMLNIMTDTVLSGVFSSMKKEFY
ncbi:MAG: TetR/AcrR family transcriptional regulator [Candidatus Ventricola sp.]